jgi:hypothetical protein
MNPSNSPASLGSRSANAIRIEHAFDCDGSQCHQPIYNREGGLHHVAPHHHLVEVQSGFCECFAIWTRRATDVELD